MGNMSRSPLSDGHRAPNLFLGEGAGGAPVQGRVLEGTEKENAPLGAYASLKGTVRPPQEQEAGIPLTDSLRERKHRHVHVIRKLHQGHPR